MASHRFTSSLDPDILIVGAALIAASAVSALVALGSEHAGRLVVTSALRMGPGAGTHALGRALDLAWRFNGARPADFQSYLDLPGSGRLAAVLMRTALRVALGSVAQGLWPGVDETDVYRAFARTSIYIEAHHYHVGLDEPVTLQHLGDDGRLDGPYIGWSAAPRPGQPGPDRSAFVAAGVPAVSVARMRL